MKKLAWVVGALIALLFTFNSTHQFIECATPKSPSIYRQISSSPSPQNAIHRCIIALTSAAHPIDFRPTSAKLDQWLEADISDMKRLLKEQDVAPSSLRRVSRIERVRNEIFFSLIKNLNGFIARNSRNGFVNALAEIVNKIEKSPFNIFVKGSAFARIKNLLDNPSILQENGGRDLRKFSEFQTQFDRDLAADKEQYGEAFFDKETVAQGAINSFAIKLFAFLNGNKSPHDRLSANAISLLHPIVDAAMDKGLMGKKTFEKLDRFLSDGERPHIEGHYEKLLFGYLYRFESVFPRNSVPGFWLAIKRLFDSQVESLKQISGEYSSEFYYRLALDKGGLSTVLAAYTALGPLTERQFAFFYRSGGIFQVIDDLLDIRKDLGEGVTTTWTNAIRNRESFGPPMRHLFALEKDFESRLNELSQDFDNPGA
ncbi:MAG: class 1 isoprenoid biosynthesis enzyme, partial [Bdellovibrionales bacterium]|nr:class 1 isoprenoid biosynthesis enzyme [Bdellovibrionales bacterium]